MLPSVSLRVPLNHILSGDQESASYQRVATGFLYEARLVGAAGLYSRQMVTTAKGSRKTPDCIIASWRKG